MGMFPDFVPPKNFEVIACALEAQATINPGDEEVSFFLDGAPRKPKGVTHNGGAASLRMAHHFYFGGISLGRR